MAINHLLTGMILQVGDDTSKWRDLVIPPPENEHFAPKKLPKPKRKGKSLSTIIFEVDMLNFRGVLKLIFQGTVYDFHDYGKKSRQVPLFIIAYVWNVFR